MTHGLEGKDQEYIPCDILFNDKQWYKVGIRAKGNSSLKSSWSNGVMKLPFKLDFDEYEDTYPAITDQRFYGFRQLSLKNAFSDNSLVREKVIDELFSEAGLPSIRAAFYRVYVDRGHGPEYFGLYTLVEDVDDVFLSENFENPDGNLYKPEGKGATFNQGDFTLNDFEIHQSSTGGEMGDIQQLYDALHHTNRKRDPEAWRNELDQIFDSNTFIRWLACNTTVQNWDTYGMMHHNFYLYHEPQNDYLVWIHWDNNEALMEGKMNKPTPDFGFETVTDEWPLIRYLMDDPVYQERFKDQVEHFITNEFYPEKMLPILMKNMNMIEPFVVGEKGERKPFTQLRDPRDFNRERNRIRGFMEMRYEMASRYVRTSHE